MCGINGFNFPDKELILKMNESLRHRGPDDHGIYVDQHVSLGQTRLAIIDLSPRGHQPMSNEDKTLWITFNGEVYNYREIRELLEKKGHNFFSETDTEVIVHAYQEYGEHCLSMFNGMFAIAIWDLKKKEFFLARDRIGIKPIFYYHDEKKFIFSSEIKGIFQHGIKSKIDLEAMNHYLRLMYIPAPLTIYQNIKKLMPGHFLRFKDNQITIKKYWDINDFENIKSYDEIAYNMRRIFSDSVRMRLISDRPVGVFLSGGIDSTAVLAQVKKLKKDKIKTFSVGFDVHEEKEKFNEDFLQARKTANLFETEHHELLTSSGDILKYLEKVVYHLDEPLANSNHVSTYLLSKMAKKEVAVVLGGDGGDELFGGYDKYNSSLIISKYQLLPSYIRNSIVAFLIKTFFKNRKIDLNYVLNLPADQTRYLHFSMDPNMAKILNPQYNLPSTTNDHFKKYFFNNKNQPSDFEKMMMLGDIKSWLTDESLARSDRMTMAFGLEQRVPFLDYRLIELAMKIPTSSKIKFNKNKLILKRVFADLLPAEIVNKKKLGWNAPIAKWMRTGLKDFVYDTLSEKALNSSPFFDYKNIKTILDNHISKKEYNAQLLWLLIIFQLWYDKNCKNLSQ